MIAEPVPAGSDVSAGTYRCTDWARRMRLAQRPLAPVRDAQLNKSPQ
jgi:hypothetical protein